MFIGDLILGYDFKWLATWSKIGLFSGLESLIRNVVYLVVILRAMNILNEQGSYWVANTFIWNGLLLPILPLADLIKQDIASSNINADKMTAFGLKLFPYLTMTTVILLIWLASVPLWPWFLTSVLNADKPDLVLELIKQLAPCYACFTFALLFLNGVLYALGRTDYIVLKSIMGNSLLVTLFLLFSNGILFKAGNVYALVSIFGTGLVFGTVTSVFFLVMIVRKLTFIQ